MGGDDWFRVGEGEVGRGVVGKHSWTDLNNSRLHVLALVCVCVCL